MAENHRDDDNTQTHIPLLTDTKVGHYRIVEKIGAGGMGEVYLAEDTELDRKVALKFLPNHLCQDEECHARFRREAQAAAKLDHPNIVTVHEVGEYQGRPYFAMAHVEGQSLKEYSSGKDLAIEQILELGIQICKGLQAAHDKGIIHRDIKPSNILIDSHGRARIVDFGLASVVGKDQLTKAGSTLGTVGYMSPEQIEGKATDARSDLFSLGVVLYELIANKSPFRHDDETATLKAILQDAPLPLARYNSNVPDDLQRIISKLLEKDPSLRYQSAAGVIPDLKKLSSAFTATVAVERKPDRRNRYIVPSAVIILLAAVAIWYFGYRDEAPSTSGKDDKIMLAVLPFKNLGSTEDEYFADGITEEILSRLASINSLGVISSTSSFTYKNTDKTLPQIAQELGVDYILEGNIRWDKSGDVSKVRITPQLIRAEGDIHVWSKSYDEAITDVITAQSQIARQIASALDIRMSPSEKSRIGKIPTENMESYNYYLRGKRYSREYVHVEELLKAVNMFEKAYGSDTLFAEAMAEAAINRLLLYWFGSETNREFLENTLELADKSIALQPDNAHAHAAKGYYYYYGQRDFRSALEEFEIALDLAPAGSDILRAKGLVLRRLGRFDEAFDLFRRALKLDPLSPRLRINVVETGLRLRRYEEVRDIADESISLFPEHALMYWCKAHLHVMRDGDFATAIAVMTTAPADVQAELDLVAQLSEYYRFAGDYENARSTARNIIDVASTYIDTAEFYYSMALSFSPSTEIGSASLYLDSARAYLERVRSRDLPQGGILLRPVSHIYASLGMKKKAIEAAIDDTIAVSCSTDAVLGDEPLENLAMTYVLVGELDQAMVVLERLLSVPYFITVPYLKSNVMYAPLRDHPRFKVLIEKYEKEYGI